MNFKPSPEVSDNIEFLRAHLEEITGETATLQDGIRFGLAIARKAIEERKAREAQ